MDLPCQQFDESCSFLVGEGSGNFWQEWFAKWEILLSYRDHCGYGYCYFNTWTYTTVTYLQKRSFISRTVLSCVGFSHVLSYHKILFLHRHMRGCGEEWQSSPTPPLPPAENAYFRTGSVCQVLFGQGKIQVMIVFQSWGIFRASSRRPFKHLYLFTVKGHFVLFFWN